MSERTIWNRLRAAGFNEFAVAGIMGNMQAESAFISNNVEDRSGISDEVYTRQVDSGARPRAQFIADTYGYGLCQWTSRDRKDKLYQFAKQRNVSIGNEEMQCDFLVKELEDSYRVVYTTLKNATSVSEASNVFLLKFEIPANASGQIGYRATLSQKIYAQYTGTQVSTSTTVVQDDTNVGNTAQQTRIYCYPKMPICSKGDKSRAVYIGQCGLNDLGDGEIDCGTPDGDFGNKTRNAVLTFQSKRNLSRTGQLDKATWEALFE